MMNRSRQTNKNATEGISVDHRIHRVYTTNLLKQIRILEFKTSKSNKVTSSQVVSVDGKILHYSSVQMQV